MLTSRTKQVVAYGRRNQRIVNVSEERFKQDLAGLFDEIQPSERGPIVSRMKKRENAVSKSPSPKVSYASKKKRLSPVLKPKKKGRVAQLIEAESHKAVDKTKVKLSGSKSTSLRSEASSPRRPLSSYPANISDSPSFSTVSRPSRLCSSRATPLKLGQTFTPFVDVDIIVVDEKGKKLKQERRVSRTDIQTNPINSPHQTSPPEPTRADEDEASPKAFKRPHKSVKRNVVTIYSDDSDDDTTLSKLPPRATPSTSGLYHSPSRETKKSAVYVDIPPLPYVVCSRIPTEPRLSSNLHPTVEEQPALRNSLALPQHILSPAAKGRPLTPIRNAFHRLMYNIPRSSPGLVSLAETELDLSFEMEQLNIASASDPGLAAQTVADYPEYLLPLLEECHQAACGPIEFSSFIETFPFDTVVHSNSRFLHDLRFQKVGEASYSEVFGIGDVVLKVIPIRDEMQASSCSTSLHSNMSTHDEGPPPSDAKDVRKEIIVTRAMGEVNNGFVKLLKAYVVRGRYPEVLLKLWDDYYRQKGSESVRPDTFLVSQVYAIIVLPNGGQDLEAYKFKNTSKSGWKQACSLFWQVAKSLAHAERLVSFEHRDLHWGQILVKDLSLQETTALKPVNRNQRPKRATRLWMDDLAHGVQATLIDLGLSRMDAGDGNGGPNVHWSPFDDEVFMGEGDYQFDVYRIMGAYIDGAWGDFKPLTNVMWLHYLALKLLQSKRLKPPTAPRKGKSVQAPVPSDKIAFTEKDCYDCLLDIENWLRRRIELIKVPNTRKEKAARRTQAFPTSKEQASPAPACAGEVVEYAAKKGWIKPL